MPNYQIITPANDTYDIYDDVVHLITLDGKGIPFVDRRIREAPNIDGGRDQGFHLRPRNMALRIILEASSASALDTKRDEIYEVFKPLDDSIKLKVTRDDSSVRQINCYTQGVLDIPESNKFGELAKDITVQLIAPDPIWYDPAGPVTRSFPISSTGDQGVITYSGNWFAYPIVRIHGYIENPQVYILNHNGFQLLNFITTIADGDYYEVDFNPGEKTAVDDGGNNVMSELGSSTPWGSYRIWPGDSYTVNCHVFYSGSPGANAKIEYIFYDRYIGI